MWHEHKDRIVAMIKTTCSQLSFDHKGYNVKGCKNWIFTQQCNAISIEKRYGNSLIRVTWLYGEDLILKIPKVFTLYIFFKQWFPKLGSTKSNQTFENWAGKFTNCGYLLSLLNPSQYFCELYKFRFKSLSKIKWEILFDQMISFDTHRKGNPVLIHL